MCPCVVKSLLKMTMNYGGSEKPQYYYTKNSMK